MKQEKNAVNKTGFTLIELLIVVLIIGVLTAVALPGYRKAVEKSRVTDALTTMQAVAKSEHGWYLTNNSYTNDFANLDIEINGTINEGALETDFYTYELLDTGILAGRNNREYSIYQDYETKQIMCTPGSHYICENLGAFTKEPCEKLDMAWANTNSTCYVDEEERCKGLYDDDMWNEDTANSNNSFCGYKSRSGANYNKQTLNEGMECKGWGYYSCQNSTINAGGKCVGGNWDCQGSVINDGGVCEALGYFACNGSTVNAGGICKGISDGGRDNCAGVTVNAGGECYGEVYACNGAIINGGKCTGTGHVCNGIDLNGGTCEATGNNNACGMANVHNHGECSGTCNGAIISEGSICSGECKEAKISDGGECSGNCTSAKINAGGVCSGNCYDAIINDGGICKSSPTNQCKHTPFYNGTGCCEGDYCGNKPKCDCPINPDTGKHLTSC